MALLCRALGGVVLGRRAGGGAGCLTSGALSSLVVKTLTTDESLASTPRATTLAQDEEMASLTHFCRGLRSVIVDEAETLAAGNQGGRTLLDPASVIPKIAQLKVDGEENLKLPKVKHPLWCAPFLSAAVEFELVQAVSTNAPPEVPAALVKLTEACADASLVHFDDAVRTRLTFQSLGTTLELPPLGRRTAVFNAMADELESRAESEDVRGCLQRDGFAVLPRALGSAHADSAADAVRRWLAHVGENAPSMLMPGTLDESGRSAPAVRDDVVAWLAGDELDEQFAEVGIVTQVLRRIVPSLASHPDDVAHDDARRALLPAASYLSHAMLSAYAPGCRGFARHYDRTGLDDPRRLTAVYYLNEHWDAKAHGGDLVLYTNPNKSPVHISPERDTLVLFWSDEVEHEVTAVSSNADAPRLAISVWCLGPTASTANAS